MKRKTNLAGYYFRTHRKASFIRNCQTNDAPMSGKHASANVCKDHGFVDNHVFTIRPQQERSSSAAMPWFFCEALGRFHKVSEMFQKVSECVS